MSRVRLQIRRFLNNLLEAGFLFRHFTLGEFIFWRQAVGRRRRFERASSQSDTAVQVSDPKVQGSDPGPGTVDPPDGTHSNDWSAIPETRYRKAQDAERTYWDREQRMQLVVRAKYFHYAGYRKWVKHRGLLDPFQISSSMPFNFQLSPDEIEGKSLLDIGTGPTSHARSLVHCADVHVIDPLADFYRTIQPFGWEFFSSVCSRGAEELPFDEGSFDFVLCWNVLDHTQDADRILSEVVRVLRPRGELLLACDVRDFAGGGDAHPYNWNTVALEEQVYRSFEAVTPACLMDPDSMEALSRKTPAIQKRWVCRLRKKR